MTAQGARAAGDQEGCRLRIGPESVDTADGDWIFYSGPGTR
ncbi:ABC-type Fe3+-hydroxamate transport system substrate-binding protein [Streptomyces canus]|nr:hypothetical protein [Streptomyces canus]MDQ0599326.1 ABC-type Fe3+-hydroxamate transport system substrate-binding protein [Streptomyces canus]